MKIELVSLVCLGFMGMFNMGLTLLNFKLFTEFVKQRMQEKREKERS